MAHPMQMFADFRGGSDGKFLNAFLSNPHSINYDDITLKRAADISVLSGLDLSRRVFGSMIYHGQAYTRIPADRAYEGNLTIVPTDHPTHEIVPLPLANAIWQHYKSSNMSSILKEAQKWAEILQAERIPPTVDYYTQRGIDIRENLDGLANVSIWGAGNWDGNPKYTAEQLLDSLRLISNQWRQDRDENLELAPLIDKDATGDGFLQLSRRIIDAAVGSSAQELQDKENLLAKLHSLAGQSRLVQVLIGLKHEPELLKNLESVLLANCQDHHEIFFMVGILGLFDCWVTPGLLIEDRDINHLWSTSHGRFRQLLRNKSFKAYCMEAANKKGLDKPTIILMGAPSDLGMLYGANAHLGMADSLVSYMRIAEEEGYVLIIEFGCGTSLQRMGGPRPVNLVFGLPDIRNLDLYITTQGGPNALWFCNREVSELFVQNIQWVLAQKSPHNPDLSELLTEFANITGSEYNNNYAGQMRRLSMESPWLEVKAALRESNRAGARPNSLRIRAIGHTDMMTADGRTALSCAFIAHAAEVMGENNFRQLFTSRKFGIHVHHRIPQLVANWSKEDSPDPKVLELQQVFERDFRFLAEKMDIRLKGENPYTQAIRRMAYEGGLETWDLRIKCCMLESIARFAQDCG